MSGYSGDEFGEPWKDVDHMNETSKSQRRIEVGGAWPFDLRNANDRKRRTQAVVAQSLT